MIAAYRGPARKRGRELMQHVVGAFQHRPLRRTRGRSPARRAAVLVTGHPTTHNRRADSAERISFPVRNPSNGRQRSGG
jgi:hypothetical protein